MGRGALAVLAFLALAMKVIVPPGYMAAPARAEGPPFALVLCTAQGPVPAAALPSAAQDETPHEPADADGARHNPCVFAGHASGAEGPELLSVGPAVFADYVAPALAVVPAVAPGRGLAAPPLPARGPPHLTA
ncbi:MAG: hypothetical protein H2041_04405 [Phenylobacterium sp.]|nr:hypothetical protein [Phenylobacterium sp.]